ncbi:MAG: ferrous iron transporter B [Candidatus Thermoplasmatota archaeon]|nr:ferrous iron transporter B [Candidatus Thermoplasmatota archaeon]MBU1941342.1 ferrous iron transporter B [Candidatus Thermoplasmatota archaeon]
MKTIVLMGNPNVGKSVVFSRLTGANVISSNYPGTTVDFSKGKMRYDGTKSTIIDAPGTYSLEPSNRAEQVAVNILKEADIIINVVDATNLERNLYLTLQLLEQNIPIVIALNIWDETQHLGIHIDIEKLKSLLKIPIIPIVALTGEGIHTLVSQLQNASSPPHIKPTSDEGRWIEIGTLIKQVERVEHRHHTLRNRISDLTIKPGTGLPIALAIIFFTFWIVRLIGENLITYVLDPIFELLYKPLITQFGNTLGSGFLYNFLISQSPGEINFLESLGLLTTGLYVPLTLVLPYIIAFYFMLSVLEDTGYLPRLATLMDNIFHKLGMHGYGVVPVFLGLGCNVPGMLATRSLETRKQRFIAATLLSIAVPCMAQTSLIFAMFSKLKTSLQYPPFFYITIVFTTLIMIYFIVGYLLNKLVKGECPEIFLEMPNYRVPHFKTTLKKTWMRIRWFLKDALPWMFLGVFLINVLYTLGIIEYVASLFQPLMTGIFGLPGETSVVLLSGFLRKDLAVGTLLSFPIGTFSEMQLVIIATLLTIYFPCVATFAVMIKELGIKDMIKAAVIMLTVALFVAISLRLILIGN